MVHDNAVEELAFQIEESIMTSGLLTQSGVDAGGWKPTRASGPEIVAFTNKALSPAFDRLAVEFFEAGETDEDGYTWDNDAYVVEARDRGDRDAYAEAMKADKFDGFHGSSITVDSRSEAARVVALIMLSVSEARDTRQEVSA